MLSAAYDFLRHTKPFDGWNLPEPEDVKFGVLKGRSRFGDCGWVNGKPSIRLSTAMHDRYVGVMTTLSHEMIHLHMDNLVCTGRYKRLRTDNATHGPTFRAFAAQVLEHHLDFDPVTF